MPYLINRFNGEPLLTLNDGELNTATSLSLLGKNYIGYGELQNENFIHLLENFAGSNPPPRPISGQTWFDNSKKILNVYDGQQWNLLGAASISIDAPENPAEGYFWYKIPDGVLYVFNNGTWSSIGPENAEGFGITRARSTVLQDSDNNLVPVILITVNNLVIAIVSDRNFTVNPQTPIFGFGNVSSGITLSSQYSIVGNLQGNANTATRLNNPRTINGVPFDGQSNIIISATPEGVLNRGDYLIGSNYNGSSNVTWSVDATPVNVIGKVIARDSSGSFSANNISANLVGNVTGNVNAQSGTSNFDIIRANQIIGPIISGNAFSATKLLTARKINGVSFDGTSDINITVDAVNISGTELNVDIKKSNLQSLGELDNVKIKNAGIVVGAGDRLFIRIVDGIPTIQNNSNDLPLRIVTTDTSKGLAGLQIISSSQSLANSGDSLPSITPTIDQEINLGHPSFRFNKIYFNQLVGDVDGNADTASLAIRSNNISGGIYGSVPYQIAVNNTAMLPPGTNGQILTTRGSGSPPEWTNPTTPVMRVLTPGQYIQGSGYDGSQTVFWNVIASSGNESDKLVARDSSGDFSARNINVNQINVVTVSATTVSATTFNGNLQGQSSTAAKLSGSPTINGIVFDGSQNITISTEDNTKVSKSGDSMTGFLNLHAAPTAANHAATKNYVDGKLSDLAFTYGALNAVGFTNQVGSFNNTSNYFDVFPPSGFTMSNLAAFIPSINVVHYAGNVDSNDSLRCTYQVQSDRIRVWVQNTEQRSTPAGNYLAIWRR